MASSIDIPALKLTLAQRNLARLSQYEPPSPPEQDTPSESQKCSIGLQILEKWSEDNKAAIQHAIEKAVFGGKSDIDWKIAFLPFMESMGVYLRDWGFILSAWKAYRQYQHGKRQDKTQLEVAISAYQAAYQPIEDLAAHWGLDFVCLCDLVTEAPDQEPLWDGPICGAFFTTSANKTPFVGLAFKGTNPFQFREVAVDYNYQLQQASAQYLEQNFVSAGVYTGLFGTFKDGNVPFDVIQSELQLVARSLPNYTEPVSTHVTGHSLGGSYTQLCFAQMLVDANARPPKDFSFAIGDQYSFGAPRVGNEDWAKANATWIAAQRGSIWRIVNNKDIVPQVPATMLKPDQLDFYHVDNGKRISKNHVPENIPSEIGSPPPPPYSIKTFKDLVNAVIQGGDHRE